MADEGKDGGQGAAGDGGQGGQGGDGGKPPETITLTHEQLEDRFKDRVTRALKTQSTKMRDELLADEEFKSAALKRWGAKPAKEAEKLDDQKVQEMRSAWEQEHLTPLQTRLQEIEVENRKLYGDQLEAAVLAAAGGLAKKGVLKLQGNGHSALYNMIASEFVFDADTKSWRVRGKKEGEFRQSSSGEKVYMDPAEFIVKVWAGDPENADFVLDRTQQGSSFRGGDGKDGKRIYTRAQYDAHCRDEAYFAANVAELLAANAEGRVRG